MVCTRTLPIVTEHRNEEFGITFGNSVSFFIVRLGFGSPAMLYACFPTTIAVPVYFLVHDPRKGPGSPVVFHERLSTPFAQRSSQTILRLHSVCSFSQAEPRIIFYPLLTSILDRPFIIASLQIRSWVMLCDSFCRSPSMQSCISCDLLRVFSSPCLFATSSILS